MTDQLQGKRVAILATDGVERVELEQPRDALPQARAETDLPAFCAAIVQALAQIPAQRTA
jgi:protease I